MAFVLFPDFFNNLMPALDFRKMQINPNFIYLIILRTVNKLIFSNDYLTLICYAKNKAQFLEVEVGIERK